MEVDNPAERVRKSPASTVEPRQSSQVPAPVGRDDDDQLVNAQSVLDKTKHTEQLDPDEVAVTVTDNALSIADINITDGPGADKMTNAESTEIENPAKRFCKSPKTADDPSSSLVLATVGDDVLVVGTRMIDADLSPEENRPDETVIDSGDQVPELEKNIDESTNKNIEETDLPTSEKLSESNLKLLPNESDVDPTTEELPYEKMIEILELMKQGNNDGHGTMNQSNCDSLKYTDEKSTKNADENDQNSSMSTECSKFKDSTVKVSINLNFNKTILKHPAPLPEVPHQSSLSAWKPLPPAPKIMVLTHNLSSVKFFLTLDTTLEMSDIKLFEIYFYEEHPLVPPKKGLWEKFTEFTFEYLPFAFELNGLPLKCKNPKVHFAVRVVDEHGRKGPFSEPKSTMLI